MLKLRLKYNKLKKLPIEFYNRNNVVQIARELLGKVLVTKIEGLHTAGRIVETEAYLANGDAANHAYNGRRTTRNESMYAGPGTLYMYICYGMHQMANVVTNKAGIPDAVLLRAVEPLTGMDSMQQRTGKKVGDTTLTRGPGNTAKALGLHRQHDGLLLRSTAVYIADDGFVLPATLLGISGRIGIEGAGPEAVAMPYRFYVKGNKYVSGKR